MIAFVRGIVSHIGLDQCFIDVHGVGYRVYITEATRLQLLEGEERTLFTYCNVREDAFQLYGFLTEAEYDLFCLLISVSGIGPKVAMGILSGMDALAIKTAIATENIPVLVKLPGIGKKSAERLVLELKDKIGNIPVDVPGLDSGQLLKQVFQPPAGPVEEVLVALAGLGYVESEVKTIVESLAEQHTEVSDLLRAALQELGKKA